MPQEEEGFSANSVEEPSGQTPPVQTNSEITESPKRQTNVFSSGDVPVIICACLCVLFMNIGLLSLFYLAPLGYAVLVYKRPKKVFFTAAIVNMIFFVIANLIIESHVSVWAEILYITVLFLCFTWIMGGNKLLDLPFGKIRTVYRFVIASVAASFAFIAFVFREADLIFYKMLAGAAEMLSTALPSSVFTTESIVEISKAILVRGGAVSGFVFALN